MTGTPSRRPLCSVVVPTYDRMALLRRTLESLTRQDLGVDAFEVLVVDDGSTDDTPAVAREYADRLRLRYFQRPDEGFRVAAARNVGITHATGDVCVFVDSGVLLHSGALRAHLACHAGATPTAVVGYVYCFNHNNEDAAQMLAALDFDQPDATIARLIREGRWLDARESFYDQYTEAIHELPAPWLVYWTCNTSARTEQLRRVGGFDEAFRSWGGEDIELAYRLHLDGAHFVVSRDAAAIHYPHEKGHAENKKSGVRNYQYIARRYDTPISRLLEPDPPLDFYGLNALIRERGLPDCAEVLRERPLPEWLGFLRDRPAAAHRPVLTDHP
ncbi:glycosyltransferase [Micromonospora rosaria]|uniref:glycosyltransferase n=1 Tax=Micromonospora rosaria TaxID=47874 RepID=UPI000830EFBC|nr:glycosyltransferase family 2 protein [Micromonospora rosaria]